MASRNVSVRLAVVDGQRVKAELTEVGEAGQKALGQIERGARPASDGLDRVARSAHSAGQAAPALGNLSHAMSGFIGGLAAGAFNAGLNALSQIPQILGNIVRAGAEAADSQRRLENVLRVTGGTAGLTSQQLVRYSEEQEASTLFTAEAIQDAAAVLATFKSVSGDTFTRTLSAAQDLSTYFKQDLKSSIVQLGKAMENPIAGLTALSRVGVTFTDEQKELIKTLEETGQRLAAQQAMLAGIESQGIMGGAAAAAQGVTGAIDQVTDAWGNFLEALGQTETVTSGIPAILGSLARGIGVVTSYVTGQANSIEAQYQRAKEHLAFIKQQKEENPIRSAILMPGAEGFAQRKVDELAGPAQQDAALSATFANLEQRFAKEAEARHQAELKIVAVKAEEKQLTEEIMKLQAKGSVGERTAQIQAELEATRKRLEGQRTAETSEGVDKAIAAAEEIARRKSALIEEEVQRAQAADARKGESAARAAEREGEARQRLAERQRQEDERYAEAEREKESRQLLAVQGLEDAYARLTNTQMGNIDLVLQRQIEANAREIEDIAHREAADIAATQRAEVEKARLRDTTLASAREEALNARAASAEARGRDPGVGEEERTAAMREGMELRVQLEREETTQRLAALQLIGLSEADFARAREDLIFASEERIKEIISKSRRDQAEEGLTAAKAAEQFTRTMSGGIAELVVAGREGFDSLTDAFQTFLDGMQKQLIQQGIEGLLGTPGGEGKAGSGLIGAIFGAFAASGGGSGGGWSPAEGGGTFGGTAAVLHSGGTYATAKKIPIPDMSIFSGAPRYHSGHKPPTLAPWERPAIITKDETVSTPEQIKNMRAPINVTINNNSSEPVQAKDDGRGNLQIDIGNVVANALSKPGSPANQTLRGIVQSEMRSGG